MIFCVHSGTPSCSPAAAPALSNNAHYARVVSSLDRFLTLMAHGGDELDWSAIGGLAAKDAGEEG
jgi:hypothetical protein